MTTLVLEAIGYGLFLSILIGPILMTLVDASVQYGLKMGITLASGYLGKRHPHCGHDAFSGRHCPTHAQ
ncbi:MAG: hypothetical protein IPN29_16895 [Saprospiraceae bacterium]|nr:hypothetical protein [Saprospiraceae bacterium]